RPFPDQLSPAKTAQNESTHAAAEKLSSYHFPKNEPLDFLLVAFLVVKLEFVFACIGDAGGIGLFGRDFLSLILPGQFCERFLRQLLALPGFVERLDFDDFAVRDAQREHQLLGGGRLAPLFLWPMRGPKAAYLFLPGFEHPRSSPLRCNKEAV